MSRRVHGSGTGASILDFFFTLVLVLSGTTYLVISASARDLMWFLPKFEARPSRIEIHCYGSLIVLDGYSSLAQEIAVRLNEQVSGDRRFDSMNLSPATHAYYRNDPTVLVLELFYSGKVRIHLPNMFFNGVTSLLVPLDGRYASSAIIFGLKDQVPVGGSFHVSSNQAIKDLLAERNLCRTP
jgi:hypothetical protein